MPVVVYSVLRLALLAVSWLLLTWAGLNPLVALLVAAFVAWGLSYAALGGPRDAAARYLADRAAARAAHHGRPVLSAHARQDADVEDAAVDAALATEPATPAPTASVAHPDRAVHPDRHAARGRGEDAADDVVSPAATAPAAGASGADDRPDAGAAGAQSASASPSSMP